MYMFVCIYIVQYSSKLFLFTYWERIIVCHYTSISIRIRPMSIPTSPLKCTDTVKLSCDEVHLVLHAPYIQCNFIHVYIQCMYICCYILVEPAGQQPTCRGGDQSDGQPELYCLPLRTTQGHLGNHSEESQLVRGSPQRNSSGGLEGKVSAGIRRHPQEILDCFIRS